MGVRLLHGGGDLLELVRRDNDGSGENLSWGLNGVGASVGGVVDESLLGLAFLSGEKNELGLVGTESFDVELELLLAGGGSSVINSDADSAGEGGAQTGLPELDESETTAISDLAGVSARAGGDNRSQLLERRGEAELASSLSLKNSDVLLGSLVEMDPDSSLPVFAEMNVWNDVIVLDHC